MELDERLQIKARENILSSAKQSQYWQSKHDDAIELAIHGLWRSSQQSEHEMWRACSPVIVSCTLIVLTAGRAVCSMILVQAGYKEVRRNGRHEKHLWMVSKDQDKKVKRRLINIQ